MLREITTSTKRQQEPNRRWFQDRNLSLFVWVDSDNEISHFQLTYSTFGGERTFDWSAPGTAANYDTESSRYAAPVLNRSVPLNAERLLHEFEVAAERLDGPIREFVADKIRSAAMDDDTVQISTEPNRVTRYKYNLVLISVAVTIAVVLAIFEAVVFL